MGFRKRCSEKRGQNRFAHPASFSILVLRLPEVALRRFYRIRQAAKINDVPCFTWQKRAFLMISIFLMCAAMLAADPTPMDESIAVTVVGTLRTGVVAIGGETTGTTITAKGIKWELDLGKSADLPAAAEKLNGKQVTVAGTLERRSGVEVKERWIVTVTSLKGT